MRKFGFFAVLLFLISGLLIADDKQSAELRSQCAVAQQSENEMTLLEKKIEKILVEEKQTSPVTRNIYNMLTSSFTLLFSIQKFHKILTLNQENNKNDFVRAAIILKNFSAYFHNVSVALRRYGNERLALRQEREKFEKLLENNKNKRDIAVNKITEISKKAEENVPENNLINDIAYHLANRSNSIEELDAELEAENTVGVLKNTKIATELKLSYPVAGRVVNEFGDKGINEQMIYYLGFETRYGAVVTSPVKGLVVFSGKFLNYNNMVIISNGEYRVFVYGLDKLFVQTGSVVEIGDYIGRMVEHSIDKPVLKLELKKSGEPLDPRHWLVETLEKENKL